MFKFMNRSSQIARVVMLFAFCVLLTTTAFSQALNTRVNGTVKDTGGAVIPGATVILRDNSTNISRTTRTNSEGYFVFNDVRQGTYTVIAEATGFKKTSVFNVKVDVDQSATVAITLEVGEVTEVVNVSAADAQIIVNTENAQLQSTVQERQINDLPLNGRNPLTLAGLQAGVNSSGGTRGAAVNGLRGTFTNLTWDGININDNFVRTDSFFGVAAPSVVSVSEFTLTTQNNGPSDGLGVAQVKLVTPRGGREFHGSGFIFHRNDAFDANSFFNNRAGLDKEKLIQNQFGFNVGGPFVVPNIGNDGPALYGKDRDKLFFYTYLEATRVRQDASRLRTVLTNDARQGLFTYVRQDNGQRETVNLFNYTNLPADPRIASLINLTPSPNDLGPGDGLNTSGFRFNSSAPSDDYLFGLRIDWVYSDTNRFEGSYSRFTSDFPNDTFNDIGEQFPGLPGGGQASLRPRGSFAWISIPAATLTNELRFGFNIYDVEFVNREPFTEGYRLGLPLITNPVQNFLPQGRDVKVYELIDNASYSIGDHFIRFGGNYRYLQVLPFNEAGRLPTYDVDFGIGNPNPLNAQNPNQFPGGLSNTAFQNASGLLALLTGVVDSGEQTFNVTSRTSGFVSGAGENRDIRNYNIGLYANDTWRIRSNLTVNFGLRYEFISVPKEQNGLALLPIDGADALFDPNAVLDYAGTETNPFFNNDWDNFAPSASFAWDPFGDGKTSIRGGAGISYVIDNTITTVRNAFRANDGLTQGATLTGISGTVSGGGIQPIPRPPFMVPRTIADNIMIDPGSALYTIDPDYEVPEVYQWNIGISREILPNTAVEVRYVGNRGAKLTRAIDFNQVIIRQNGFLEDFRRAENNLANCGVINANPNTCAQAQQLQLLNRFGLGGFLNSGTVRGYVARGEAGRLAGFYYLNRRFFLNGAFGGDPSLTPAFFARANPNAFVADLVTNGSFSEYHGLQAEIRRRFSDGLYFQANYTYSKALTDAEGSQTNFDPFLDIEAGRAPEIKRISDDITHVFKANAIYELPFGSGKMFLNQGGAIDKILGGWSIGGLLTYQSGEPISIVSQRGTVNRTGARSSGNTVDTNLTIQDIQSNTGIFFDPQTGQPNLFPAGFVSNFTNPRSGTLGSLQQTPVSGPSLLFFDLSLIKRIQLYEDLNLEFRAEAFNVLNRTNFNVSQTQNINSSSFGNITSTFDPRILQFAFKINF